MTVVDAESRFHVLAVDDSIIDRKLIEMLLKTSSYQGQPLPLPSEQSVPASIENILSFSWFVPKSHGFYAHTMQ
jgi:hypothetical protein